MWNKWRSLLHLLQYLRLCRQSYTGRCLCPRRSSSAGSYNKWSFTSLDKVREFKRKHENCSSEIVSRISGIVSRCPENSYANFKFLTKYEKYDIRYTKYQKKGGREWNICYKKRWQHSLTINLMVTLYI